MFQEKIRQQKEHGIGVPQTVVDVDTKGGGQV